MNKIMNTSAIKTLFSNGAMRRLRFGALGSLMGLAMLAPTTALGWDYSNVPLFWAQGIKPNVALMIDDSGSMKAMATNEAFRRANVTGAIGAAPLNTNWYWCTGYDNGVNKRCTGGTTKVADGFHVLAWEPLTAATATVSFTVSKAWEIVNSSGGSSYGNGCESNDFGFFKTGSGTSTSTTYTTHGICRGGHDFNEGDTVKFNGITGSGSTNLSTATTYYIVNSADNGFRLATSSGGAPISFTVSFGGSSAGSFNFTVTRGLPQYIADRDVSLCNVTKAPGAANFYIGNSGSAPAVTLANLPTANQVGVLVTNKSGGAGTMDSCVRWKMSSTARSTDTSSPQGWDYTRYNTGTNYDMDSNTPYGNFLLNTLVGAKASHNFDNSAIYPDRDTSSTTRDWDAAKDKAVSAGGTAADNKHFIIPSATRVEAAREAAQKVVLDFYDKLNMGLFRLNTSPRLIYAVPDGSDPDGMKTSLIGSTESMLPADLPLSAIDGFIGQSGASGGTPLSSTQNTINNYFWGGTSPITYRCQKNYVVVMTDGESSDGGGIEGYAQDGYDTDAKNGGNDADGISWNDPSDSGKWAKQNIIPYTIGLGLENNLLKRTPLVDQVKVTKSEITGNTIKLAKHGLETGDYVQVVSNAANGLTNGRFYYAVKVDGDRFKLAGSASGGQTDSSTTNDKQKAFDCAATGTTSGTGPCLPVSNGGTGAEMTMSIGPGKAFFSFTPDQLAQDMSSVFNRINNLTASASAVSTNTKQFGGAGAALVYQARFNTEDWSGEVAAYNIVVDGTGKASVDTSETAIPAWTTKTTLMTAGQRTPNVFTWNRTDNAGKDLVWGNLDAAQQASLIDETTGNNVINWLKGQNVVGLRSHSSKFGLLGDVLNSDPAYFSYQDFGYSKLPTSGPDSGASSYQQYVEDGKTRTPMIFVGANDGMLHGFDSLTGVETLAFLPAAIYQDWDDVNNDGLNNDGPASQENKLLNLTSPVYDHRYFVDGSTGIWDAYNGSWRSYLVGALGRGGRSVYAIDVTDTSYSASDIQWEFTNPNLGYTYGKPIVARLANNQWYAIFPNGLDSNNDQASVFLVNINNASDYTELKTNVGSPATPNGMMTLQIKINSERTVTDIYAGDMRGNIWKFDMYNEGTGAASWPGVGTKLFTAGSATTGSPQAITGGISIGKHPDGLGSLIFFGTGKYFEVSDNTYNGVSVPQVDSFYAVLDNGTTTNMTRSQLHQQTFSMTGGGNRTSSTDTVAYAGTEKGWYIDLLDGSAKRGERVISTPVLYGDRIIFVSIIPLSGASCGGEGSSYLNELSALHGGMLPNPVLDTNNDGRIDGSDDQISSMKLTGLSSDPSIIRGSDRDYKIIGNTQTSSSITATSETQPAGGGGGEWGKGRLSWQQLQ